MEIKKYQLIIAATLGTLALGGTVYKGVTAVNGQVTQIKTNTLDIVYLSEDVKLNRLKELHRQALSDYYYWDAQCKKTESEAACRKRDETKRRVDNLEAQIEEIEKKRR